jgi:uncharacterized membrane protein YoaK (UPF0700 family)
MSETKSGAALPLPRGPALSVSETRLPALLAVIAGMVDLTGFLTLGNVFTAHVTGNLVVLAAVAVRGGPLNLAQALAVPAFALTVAAVWLFARTEAARNAALMRRLLRVQFLLLAGVLGFAVVTHPSADPHGLMAGAAVLVAASAMACQNALLHMTVAGAPSTAVMTGNLVSATLALLDAVSPDPTTRARAGPQIGKFLPLLLGFFLGCVIAAMAVSRVGDWAWSLPAALAGLAAACRWTAARPPRLALDVQARDV